MTIRPPGPGLPSDAILVKHGFDGWEQPCFAPLVKEGATVGAVRVTFALNTYYPEVSGHTYLNRQLLSLFDACLNQLRLHVVDPDCFGESALIPTESFVGLEEGECYAIVDEHRSIVGYTAEWRLYRGVSNAFYNDSFLVDFVFFDVDVDEFCGTMAEVASQNRVKLNEAVTE